MESASSPRLATSPQNLPKGPFRKTSTNKNMRLRQNYILSTEQDYNHLKDEVHSLINSPKFNRFISLKKNNIEATEKLLVKYKVHEANKRKPLESTFNRRQLYFMRQRRPDYNSPLKTRAEEVLLKEIGNKKANCNEILVKDQDENAMLIKQMVTHIEQPKRMITPIEDPYSPRSSHKYYVAEVTKHFQNVDSLARDHIFNSMYFLQLLEKYNFPQNQPPIQPLNLQQKQKYRGKYTIVFDLDETLVHCFEDITEPHQIQIPIRFHGGGSMLAPLNIRPGAKELLAELSEQFEIIVFTASHESYADEVINYLDPKRQYVQHRLYRRNCEYIDQGYYVKDLRLLGRDLSKVVLVDNAAYSYCFQVANGIPIIPYYEGSSDYQMRALKVYLHGLRGDVRESNKQAFRLQEYSRYSEVEELVRELYL